MARTLFVVVLKNFRHEWVSLKFNYNFVIFFACEFDYFDDDDDDDYDVVNIMTSYVEAAVEAEQELNW